MYDWLYLTVIYPIIFIFPAYVANGAPVIFGGGMPLDFNRRIGKKRIFGNHKTVKGLIAGICSGIIIAFAESLFPGYGFMLLVGTAQSFGTHAGDLLGSFIKRQKGYTEGEKSIIMDQYLFLVMALLFSIPFGNLPSIYGIIFLFILTGIMHPLTNLIAHTLKLKEVPW